MKPGRRWSDEQIERIISYQLRFGVLLSALLVMVGGVVYLAREADRVPHYRVFRGEPPELRTVGGIIHRALAFDGRGIIELGLLVLIATPVIRVAFSVVAFALEGDYLYVGITLIVLAVLTFSLAGGRF